MTKKAIWYACAIIGAGLVGLSFTYEPSFTQTIMRILAFIVPGLGLIFKGGNE